MATILHERDSVFQDTLPGISISRQEGSGTTPPHWHERMEIWQIHGGQITVSCDQDIFDVLAGDILIIHPGQVHSGRVVQSPASIDCLIFDIHALLANQQGEINRLLREIGSGKLRFQHIIRQNRQLQQILGELVAVPARQCGSSMQVTGLLYQFFAVLIRQYVAEQNHPVPRHLQEVGELLEYIHTHYAEALTLEQLAAVAYRSPAYLCRWFKEAVGEPPMAYVTTVRINKAYELLAAGTHSVTAACAAVGMGDLNSFNRQFRRRVGLLPSKVKAESKQSFSDVPKKDCTHLYSGV